MSTYYAKVGEVPREWVLIDATDQVLGRVASETAQILKGKRKPQYTPHVDTGDFVVIINADKIAKPSIRDSILRNIERLNISYKLIKLDDRAALPLDLSLYRRF